MLEQPQSEAIVFSECPLVYILVVVEWEVWEVCIGQDMSCVERVFDYVRVLPGHRVYRYVVKSMLKNSGAGKTRESKTRQGRNTDTSD